MKTEVKQKETYDVELVCRNCGHIFRQIISYGIEWRNVAECPNCGCEAENLERVEK